MGTSGPLCPRSPLSGKAIRVLSQFPQGGSHHKASTKQTTVILGTMTTPPAVLCGRYGRKTGGRHLRQLRDSVCQTILYRTLHPKNKNTGMSSGVGRNYINISLTTVSSNDVLT